MDPAPLKQGWLCKADLVIFGLVFLGVLSVALIYTFQQPRLYQSTGTLQFYPDSKAEGRIGLGEMVTVLDSSKSIQNAVERLKDTDRTALLKPYGYASNVGASRSEGDATCPRV